MLQPLFPTHHKIAYDFYEEAVRHLHDAHVLHQAGRYAGAVKSTLKATELGIKSAFIFDGLVGRFDRLFKTHKPLTETEKDPIFSRLNTALNAHRKDLHKEVKEMEKLEPRDFDTKNTDPLVEANTEYPFMSTVVGQNRIELRLPGAVFGVIESRDYHNLAHELLTALQVL